MVRQRYRRQRREVRPEYGTDYSGILSEGLGLYGQVRGMQQDISQQRLRQAQAAETAEIKDIAVRAEQGNIDPNELARWKALDPKGYGSFNQRKVQEQQRFQTERAQLADRIADLPLEQQKAELDQRISMVEARGENPWRSVELKRKLDSGHPDTIQEGQKNIRDARDQAYQQGILKRPDKTSMQKNVEYAMSLPEGHPLKAQLMAGMGKKAGTTIYTGQKPISKAEEYRAKGQEKEFGELATKYAGATEAINIIDNMKKMDIRPGYFEPHKTKLIAMAEGLGMNTGGLSRASTAQALESERNKMVQRMMQAQKGPQTEPDVRMYKKTLAGLGDTPQAFSWKLKSAMSSARATIEEYEFKDSYFIKNRTFDGANKAWRKHIKDVPRISKYRKRDGLPVFYYEFADAARRRKPDAKEEDIIELWNLSEDEFNKRNTLTRQQQEEVSQGL